MLNEKSSDSQEERNVLRVSVGKTKGFEVEKSSWVEPFKKIPSVPSI